MEIKELSEQVQGAVAEMRNFAGTMDEEAKKYGAALPPAKKHWRNTIIVLMNWN
jgi:hypothetical protein